MAGLNFADIFETVVDTTPDAPALVVRSTAGDEVRLTFAELDARVNRLAHVLARPRRRPGRPHRLPPLRRQPVRRGDAGRLQGAGRAGQRELPVRRRGARVPVRQRRPQAARHRARPRGPGRAGRQGAGLGLPGGGGRRPLRGAAGRPTGHPAGGRGPGPGRPVRPVDRGDDGHAQGRDVAARGHLPVGGRAAAATRRSASPRWPTSTTWPPGPRPTTRSRGR